MPHTKPISIKTNIEDYVKCRLLDWANWFKTDQYGNNHLKHKKENIIAAVEAMILEQQNTEQSNPKNKPF